MRGGKGIICKMPRLEVTYEARENVNKWNREQKLKQRGSSFLNNLQKLILLGLCQPLRTIPRTGHGGGYGQTSYCTATNRGISALSEESGSPHS